MAYTCGTSGLQGATMCAPNICCIGRLVGMAGLEQKGQERKVLIANGEAGGA